MENKINPNTIEEIEVFLKDSTDGNSNYETFSVVIHRIASPQIEDRKKRIFPSSMKDEAIAELIAKEFGISTDKVKIEKYKQEI